tara:strand:- start:170 stop:424 length:255 start_codon:yes stop_codon:yes gene_type:complete
MSHPDTERINKKIFELERQRQEKKKTEAATQAAKDKDAAERRKKSQELTDKINAEKKRIEEQRRGIEKANQKRDWGKSSTGTGP